MLDDLQCGLSSQYMIKRSVTTVTLEWTTKGFNLTGGVIMPIPPRYETLMRRFIYRALTLERVLACEEGISMLNEHTKTAIQHNLIYHFRILEFCCPGFREASKQPGNVNVNFFDIYMREDNYVGRHDPAAVSLWQRDHPGQNLRTMNVFTLGE